MHVLLVGEGDFSFSRGLMALTSTDELRYALAADLPVAGKVDFVASSLDSKEELLSQYPGIQKTLQSLTRGKHAKIIHGVNAANLALPADSVFDLIIWNHPHLGIEDVHQHRRLLAHFLHAALRRIRGDRSRIVIRQLEGQFERWDVAQSIHRLGLVYQKIPFDPASVPGYVVKRNRSAKSFTSTEVKKNWVFGGNSALHTMSSYSIVITREPLSDSEISLLSTGPQTQNSLVDTHRCEVCGKIFSTAQGVRTHSRQIHELKLSTSVPSGPALKRPRLQEEAAAAAAEVASSAEAATEQEHCDICDEHFPSLETHLASFVPALSTTATCSQCSRNFKDERALSQHLMQQHKLETRSEFCVGQKCPDLGGTKCTRLTRLAGCRQSPRLRMTPSVCSSPVPRLYWQ